jgi:hypothetical protein
MTLDANRNKVRPQEDHWVPLSDLMTGLMMIFLLVAIVFMLQVKRNEAKIVEAQNKIREIATKYTDLRGQLHQELSAEFRDDLNALRTAMGARSSAGQTSLILHISGFCMPITLTQTNPIIIRPTSSCSA